MSFFGKLKSRKLSKALAAVVASGVLFFGANNVSAATDDAVAYEFRQDYLSLVNDVRTFQQGIVFFGTMFKVDILSQGQILRDSSMRMAGNISWAYTNPKTKITTNNDMPFYVTNINKEMMLYVQRGGKWSKFMLPEAPMAFAAAVQSNDMSVLQDNLKAVKDVELFRETERQKIFNITLDGKYMAERLHEFQNSANTSKLSTAEIAAQSRFFRNLETALTKTDVICTWTVDRDKNETLTAVVDLTPLMRAYAESVLDEAAAGKIVLSDEDRLLMETIGYYSEFHYSLSSSKITDTKSLSPSSAAQKAPVNNNVFNDLFKDMTTSVGNR